MSRANTWRRRNENKEKQSRQRRNTEQREPDVYRK